MSPQDPAGESSISSFAIASPNSARRFGHDTSRRFYFRVSPRWRSPALSNPFAEEAQQQVIAWFEGLGCTAEEMERARRFDVAGYVGIPFPAIPREETVRIAKYLSLWLLWDDVEVETLEDRWKTDAEHVLARHRPPAMSRFDEGWWQLLSELAASRSPRWIRDLCGAMDAWNAAATEEAEAMASYRRTGEPPSFDDQLEMRVATIGMYATVYLLEHAYGVELPRDFHAHPTVLRIKWLANEIVGLGNDILSFGKDYKESQINLVTTLMHHRQIPVDDAIAHLVRMHDDALVEYDRLADSLDGWPAETTATITRWLQDVRYASLGFSLWESQAPRYTAYKVVASGRVIEPKFSFFPPRRSEPPSRPPRSSMPPSARHRSTTVEHT